jgi:hypothetical protein
MKETTKINFLVGVVFGLIIGFYSGSILDSSNTQDICKNEINNLKNQNLDDSLNNFVTTSINNLPTTTIISLSDSNNIKSGLSLSEMIDFIQTRDVNQSSKLCDTKVGDFRDFCYSKLATYSNQSIFCFNILENSSRDNCFIILAHRNNFSNGYLCDYIKNDIFRRSCIIIRSSHQNSSI